MLSLSIRRQRFKGGQGEVDWMQIGIQRSSVDLGTAVVVLIIYVTLKQYGLYTSPLDRHTLHYTAIRNTLKTNRHLQLNTFVNLFQKYNK